MGIKFDSNSNVWIVSHSKRHPITRSPVTLRREFQTKAEAKRGFNNLVIAVEDRIRMSVEPKWERLTVDWYMAVKNGDIFTNTLSDGARDDYRFLLEKHTQCWADKYANDISKADAWGVLHQVETTLSKARAKKLRSAIDNVFQWAISSGRLQKLMSLPTEGFKWSVQTVEKMPEILTREQISVFLKYAKKIENPWYPIWALALYTGMRSGELYTLKWDVIDFENKLLHVHLNWTNRTGYGPTKGRYWRSVPIECSEVLILLKGLKLTSHGSEYVLPRRKCWEDGRQAEILREFLSNCGLPSIRFHALRACFATQLIRDRVAPAVIMKICVWKDLKTMQRYIRYAGIEVQGATASLKFLNEAETMGRVVELFNG